MKDLTRLFKNVFIFIVLGYIIHVPVAEMFSLQYFIYIGLIMLGIYLREDAIAESYAKAMKGIMLHEVNGLTKKKDLT